MQKLYRVKAIPCNSQGAILFKKQSWEIIISRIYKTKGMLLKYAIPDTGCWKVSFFKNPLETYKGFSDSVLVVNHKIIKQLRGILK